MPRVDDTALATLAQANAGLKAVQLYASNQYSDIPVLSIAAHCAFIVTLDCTGLFKLTDASLHALSRGCHALRELLLSWAIQLTDAGVISIAKGCALEVLSLHGIKSVGQPSLEALVAHCAATLVALDVRGCIALKSRTPEMLVNMLPKLNRFVLHTT